MKRVKNIILFIIIMVIGLSYSYGVWPRPIYDASIGSLSHEPVILEGEMLLVQEFRAHDAGMEGIRIRLSKLGENHMGRYRWTLSETESKHEVGSGVISDKDTRTKEFLSKNIRKQGSVFLSFDRQKDSQDKVYRLEIQGEELSPEEKIGVYTTQKDAAAVGYFKDGKEEERAITALIQYRRFHLETFIVFLGIVLYFILFIRFMYRIFR